MQTFDLDHGPALLARTPVILDAWLRDLPSCWLTSDEGPDTWNAEVVVGHLIEGERHDWVPRALHLLQHGENEPFPKFDRFAQMRAPARPLSAKLDEFATLRRQSLAELAALELVAEDLARRGRHPELGQVTLGQHLATWVAHDLTHLVQIARAMAHRYRQAVGPWQAYLRVVRGDA